MAQAFNINAIDQLELNGKPATIQAVIDALWADDFHEQEPMTGSPEVCLCWLCQSLIPALTQMSEGSKQHKDPFKEYRFNNHSMELGDIWLTKAQQDEIAQELDELRAENARLDAALADTASELTDAVREVDRLINQAHAEVRVTYDNVVVTAWREKYAELEAENARLERLVSMWEGVAGERDVTIERLRQDRDEARELLMRVINIEPEPNMATGDFILYAEDMAELMDIQTLIEQAPAASEARI